MNFSLALTLLIGVFYVQAMQPAPKKLGSEKSQEVLKHCEKLRAGAAKTWKEPVPIRMCIKAAADCNDASMLRFALVKMEENKLQVEVSQALDESVKSCGADSHIEALSTLLRFYKPSDKTFNEAVHKIAVGNQCKAMAVLLSNSHIHALLGTLVLKETFKTGNFEMCQLLLSHPSVSYNEHDTEIRNIKFHLNQSSSNSSAPDAFGFLPKQVNPTPKVVQPATEISFQTVPAPNYVDASSDQPTEAYPAPQAAGWGWFGRSSTAPQPDTTIVSQPEVTVMSQPEVTVASQPEVASSEQSGGWNWFRRATPAAKPDVDASDSPKPEASNSQETSGRSWSLFGSASPSQSITAQPELAIQPPRRLEDEYFRSRAQGNVANREQGKDDIEALYRCLKSLTGLLILGGVSLHNWYRGETFYDPEDVKAFFELTDI